MVKDPVCGMNVDEKTAKLKSDFTGKTYYFCAPSCKATFDKTRQNMPRALLEGIKADVAVAVDTEKEKGQLIRNYAAVFSFNF